MIYFALIISLVTCSLAIMSEYEPNQPKRFQMILYWLKKPIIDYREKIERQYQKELNNCNEYYSDCINELERINDKGEPMYTPEVKQKKFNYYLSTQQSRQELLELEKENILSYEWYLKPIIICVYCMPSFWGSILWVSYFGFSMPLEWITTITMSVFINAILWNIYLKLNDN